MKRAHEVYEADEDDYDYDEYGNALPMSAAEQDVDATMVDESETNKRAAANGSAAAIPGDPLSLTRCWEAALYDYKFAHPSSFEPMQQRPKTAAEKAAFVPLWYGSDQQAATTSTAHGKGKQRAKPAKKRAKTSVVDILKDVPDGPFWSPQSPTRQRSPSLVPSVRKRSTSASSSSSSASLDSDSSSESSSSFDPETLSQKASGSTTVKRKATARKRPRLPFVAEFQQDEGLDSEDDRTEQGDLDDDVAGAEQWQHEAAGASSNDLLHEALMSWYECGYRTALFHASVGIAKLPDRRYAPPRP